MLLTNHASAHTWLWILLVLASLSFASIIPFEVSPSLVKHRSPSFDSTSLSLNATNSELNAARKIVQEAIAEASKLNKARLDHPARNRYKLSPESSVGGSTRKRQSTTGDSESVSAPPLLNITAEIAAAAALVAEADASASSGNSTKRSVQKRGTFWMQDISHRGTSPWGDDSSYTIFRNVMDYGAKGDGVTDDTAAINKAIKDGKRCGEACNGSTTKNAIVYFPPGTYLVSSPIIVYFGTQMIGDANDRPTIKAAASFVGLGVLSTDVYMGDGAGADGKDNEWYVNTASFYRQIRNFKIDVTSTDPNAYVCALHYQVAQATSLQFVELIAKTGTTQQGIYAENGSGGVLADITFTGGNFGIYAGSQQFTAQRLTFNGCNTAVQIIWDWGWVWKGITVTDSSTGFRLVNDGGDGNVGFAAFMDTSFTNVKQAIVVAPPSSTPATGSTGLLLDNIGFSGVSQGVADTTGKTLLDGSSSVLSWVLGPIYNGTERTWSSGSSHEWMGILPLLGEKTIDGLPNLPYFDKAKPQYEGHSTGDFIHLKDYAKGDGSTDDTAGVQNAFNSADGKIIFADAGVYLLSDTVTVPAGTKIVGETWTQFAATGSKFGDSSKPIPMLRVGNIGDVGSVEMQDLMFTTVGPTPGAILVEWNINADSQGSAGLWDCHARLGGATGTKLTPAECPALTSGAVNDDCKTAALVMHVSRGASGYFENMWLWTADHMVDDPDLVSDKNEMTMVSVYTARGLLIESTEAVWLYGTASEHAVYYQYNLFGAQNVFAGLLQTESPYYQPMPTAPSPYKAEVGVVRGDPKYDCSGTDFDGCDSSWGLLVSTSQDVYIASAGIYSWFDDYSQDCIDVHTCQKVLVNLSKNYHRVRLQQLITIGAQYSLVSDGKGILATDNLAISGHPAWSQISLFDATSAGDADIDIGDIAVDMPPCNDPNHWVTLDDLYAAMGSFPDYCVALYATQILYRMVDTTLENYTSVDNGYDSKFDYYVKYTKEMIPTQLDEFMNLEDGAGNKYFTCTFAENGRNETSQKCPFGNWINTYDEFTIYYTLDDETGFFNELQSTYGIIPAWVKFSEKIDQVTCTGSAATCTRTKYVYEGRPLPADSITVANPKDIISQALPGFTNLRSTLASMFFQMKLGIWDGVNDEVISVLSMPVSLAQQAVESMAQVAVIGEEAAEEEKKELILTILSVVFLVIPFAGEALGPELDATILTFGRIIDLIGAGGNTALAFYDIAKEPTSAPMEILGLLMAGGLGRDSSEMGKLAKARRDMTEVDLGKIGAIFKKNDDVIQNIIHECSNPVVH
ncbi:Glucan 1,3-beta-glucosidase [Colletotrichum fructicola]|uniref:Glucan 1,3-beta-glucosidase n=1 Tax=Colletotrichum fructicola (strain Nara gc5) TaxID=1213859 RepID=L2FJH0_COLFN|nr:Glucan 1,3-beta-glucosidase [Colletotrichum fructicola]KAE9573163.1 Glucan 1,3-beta-glucosidase [Colletotrichum fructicola]KAF4426806.1 Glucan 1,3-beta-glucosidase [Colletotrichum fructicola]KAF4490822.1 Glucan 1,3-beta-glucosidase [Colletotrichum fructicola Nara gc5]KAF4885729.1 Glucan 1,3-beta-glucosidase [Colletotrichum fructicola]